MEKLTVRCASCDRKVIFEDRHIGRTVKCPGCSEPLRLERTSSATTEVLDPFAEIAEEPTSTSSPQVVAEPQRPKERLDIISSEAAESPAESRSRKKTARSFSRVDDSQGPDNGPVVTNQPTPETGSGASFRGDDGSDEPFIDELGLSELGDERSLWDAPSALPPVSKQFVKKTSRRTSVSDGSSGAFSDRASTGSARSEDPKHARSVTTFRSAHDSEKGRRYRIYALFLLTMVPLCATIVKETLDARESRLVEADNGEEQAADAGAGDPQDARDVRDGAEPVGESDDGWGDQSVEEDPAIANIDDPEEVFAILPGRRIPGAFLSRDSSLHWLFAAVSALGFMGLFLKMFRQVRQDVGAAIFGAVFTATAGIVMLMGFQWAAFASRGFWLRGSSILVLIFLIIRFFGFSYQCAMEDGNGFLWSFAGFTFGVGICEEVCKILPVIGYLGASKNASWQGACLIGLASGVGFGVSEGIMYSSSYYNGISAGDVYLVRFVSCVALHSVWTGAGAVLLYFNQDGLHGGFHLTDIISTLAMTLGVSIILHGLYDTLLKQQMPFVALLTSILSIGWLIYIVERQTRDDGPVLA